MKKTSKFRFAYLLAIATLIMLVISLPASPLKVRANSGETVGAMNVVLAAADEMIILDEEMPLGNLPEEVVIMDEEVPLANLPLSSMPLVNMTQISAPQVSAQPVVQTKTIAVSPGLVLTIAIALISLGITMIAQPKTKKQGNAA